MFKNKEIYFITIFDITNALSILKEENIIIYNLKKVDQYSYTFETDIGQKKKIYKLFKSVKLVKRTGLYRIIYNLIKRKTTITALLIALILFFIGENRIYEVTINGTSNSVSAMLKVELEAMGLKKYAPKPTFNTLLEYEKKLKTTFYDYIEFLELRLEGVNLKCSYKKRRNEIELPSKTGSRYASKSGIISHFVVSSGEIKVKENQYVEKGDLLISDTIISPSGEEKVVGVEGQVYAYTWTIVEVEDGLRQNEEEVELLTRLIDRASNLIASQFYKEEKIMEEKVLSYKIIDNIGYLKIHFTCLEDISK